MTLQCIRIRLHLYVFDPMSAYFRCGFHCIVVVGYIGVSMYYSVRGHKVKKVFYLCLTKTSILRANFPKNMMLNKNLKKRNT